MGTCHSELNGLFYCIAFVCIDSRVLTVARCNRHKVRFLSISDFPVDLQHVMAKRKPAFSMYLEAGTFLCKTAFVTPPKVDHLLSTNLNREKCPKTTNFHWRCHQHSQFVGRSWNAQKKRQIPFDSWWCADSKNVIFIKVGRWPFLKIALLCLTPYLFL